MEPFVILGTITALGRIVDQTISTLKQERELKVRKELEALKRDAAEKLQAGEHLRAERMFEKAREKELELIKIQHENQIEAQRIASQQAVIREEWANRQKNFPLLNFTALQVLDTPETPVIITRHEAIPGIDDPGVGGPESSSRARFKEVDTNLQLFLQKGYGTGSATHSTRFLEGAWGSPTLFGEAAAINLHSFLESRATLFIEYQTIKREILVNVAAWGPGSKNLNHTTFSRFTYDPSDEESVGRRLTALQSLAAAAAADSYYMLRDRAAPVLPKRLPDILDGGEPDEVINDAVRRVLGGYLAALQQCWEETPNRAVDLSLQIAEGLASLTDKSYAGPFLETSLKMFIEMRGAAPEADAQYKELLDQAASLQFAQDEDYFKRAQKLRRNIAEDELDVSLKPTIGRRALGPAKTAPTFGQRLSRAREGVRRLTELVTQLRGLAPEALDEFMSDFTVEELLGKLSQSAEALEHPTLRMVPVGITSSGKSTLVGAAIGRSLVPRGSAELSVGVLRFVHGSGGLKVREIWLSTEDGGDDEVTELEFKGALGEHDHEVETYLKKFMSDYLREGFREGRPFPRVEIETPLLPGRWRSMFALPDGVGFEFKDVPGLNSTDNNDRNLALIQSEVRGCFCIFILDWATTREDRDDKLLDTIRGTLSDTGADAESVVFVLNKFNLRDEADNEEYVGMRLKSFAATLQDGLGLSEPPEIIPMNARLWFNAQVAWGPASADAAPKMSAAAREKYFTAILKDDTPTFFKLPQDDPRRAWFVEKFIQGNPANLSDEDFRYFLKEMAYPLSGASTFCSKIADRVRQRCASLVLRPAVFDSVVSTTTFLAAVKKRFKDAQLDGADEITGEVNRIRSSTERLKEGITEEIEYFGKKTVGTLLRVATAGEAGEKLDAAFIQELRARKISLGLFREIMPNLTKDLAENIARPLRDFKPGQAMPAVWAKSLREHRAKSLYETAQSFYRAASNYQPSDDALTVKYVVQVEDSGGNMGYNSYAVQRITEAEKEYATLLGELEGAMNERCLYEIQRQLALLEEHSRSLLELFYDRIRERARQVVEDVDLSGAILASKQPPPHINTTVEQQFKGKSRLKSHVSQISVREMEVAIIRTAGMKVVDSFRFLKRKLWKQSTADLFKEVKKPVYNLRAHKVSVLPSGAGLEEQTNKIFEKHTAELQVKLLKWLSDLLKTYAGEIVVAADKVSASMANALQTQLNQSREEILKKAAQWQSLRGGLVEAAEVLEVLQTSSDITTPGGDDIFSAPMKG